MDFLEKNYFFEYFKVKINYRHTAIPEGGCLVYPTLLRIVIPIFIVNGKLPFEQT